MKSAIRPRRAHNAPITPIRAALRAGSELKVLVKDGLGAIERSHHVCFDEVARGKFTDSLDIDKALRARHEQENRWDYLLGNGLTKALIAVEPHSAENSEISTIIKKRQAAGRQLQPHLRDGVTVSKWLWVASGKVQLLPMEKASFRLDQHGIQFVGRKISAKHLA